MSRQKLAPPTCFFLSFTLELLLLLCTKERLAVLLAGYLTGCLDGWSSARPGGQSADSRVDTGPCSRPEEAGLWSLRLVLRIYWVSAVWPKAVEQIPRGTLQKLIVGCNPIPTHLLPLPKKNTTEKANVG